MSNSGTAWAVVTAALGASLITTFGSFALESRRDKRRTKSKRKSDLQEACIQVMSSAFRITQKAAAMKVNMVIRSGLSESLDILFHHRKPVDILDVHDYLYGELSSALNAQSVIWILGDKDLIKGAGDVILAMGEVVDKSLTFPQNRNPNSVKGGLERMKFVIRQFKSLTMDQTDEKARMKSVRQLSRTCAEFGQLMRKRLEVKDIDAILNVFPGLIEENRRTGDE